ncbi:MAG: SIR2 family protein, partial [Myxococcales bacterium]|nr:SIR2 family protein [Myxococcales bacterium]
MTFDDIMKMNSPANEFAFEDLLERTKKNEVVPFVGAGLSASIYPTWQNFLRKVNGQFISNPPYTNEELEECFRKGMYEEVASEICKRLGDHAFHSVIKKEFHPNRINDSDLKKAAVYILPRLFQSLVLTTNFDHVLERAYQLQGAFPKVIGPTQHGILTRALRNNLAGVLVKMHGDIDSPATDMVLTLEQYENFYNEKNFNLTKALRKSFEQKDLLFLGCGLTEDRTMEVLKNVDRSEMPHFAITCPDVSRGETISDRYRALDKRNIMAIVYDADKHEAVRIVLEELLRRVKKNDDVDDVKTRSELVRLAEALVNQSEKATSLEALHAIVAKLRELRSAHPNNEEIAELFVIALLNQSVKETRLEAHHAIVAEIRELRSAHQNNEEIARQLARALVNQSVKVTSLEAHHAIVAELRELRAAHPSNEEIARQLARALFNQSVKETRLEAHHAIVVEIRELRSAHQNNEEIARQLARALVNQSEEETSLEARRAIVDELRELRAAHPNNQEILIRFAEALVNQSVKVTSLEAHHAIVAEHQELRAAHPSNEEIARQLAMALVNQSGEETSAEARHPIVAELRELRAAHQHNETIADALARALVNQSAQETNLEACRAIVAELRKLRSAHQHNETSAAALARALFNQSVKEPRLEVLHAIVAELRELR